MTNNQPLTKNEILVRDIKKVINASDEDIALFMLASEELHLKKGEHFLKEGQISRHIGYIYEGLMMHYKIIDGVELPCDFTQEKNWVAYLKSFTTGTASEMYIKALEDTHLLTLSNSQLGLLFETQPKFIQLKNFYTELSFVRNTEYATSLASLNAKDRYYKFVKEYPQLVNRVPQYLIAAYLGIKPQSLSRIRK